MLKFILTFLQPVKSEFKEDRFDLVKKKHTMKIYAEFHLKVM